MFRSLFYDHLQESSFVLSAFTTFRLPASSFVLLVCGHIPSICMCPVYLCVGCLVVNTTRQLTDRYRAHIHTDRIRPHTKKTNDEAGSRKVVNALSKKDDP
jgi:hypothetical protein